MNNIDPFLNESFTIVRPPLDPATGQPLQECGYALFPGLALAQSEPELVVMMYDSIRFQHPDTAMFLYRGREGSDPLLNRKWSERLLTHWRNLGKPTVIIATPEDQKFFRGILTEIPTMCLYEELLAKGVSGGCNRELYRLAEPEGSTYGAAVRELAENMGAMICGDPADASSESSEKAPKLTAEELAKVPFLTSSIDVRNAMKKRGFDAVHILELIYGMGRSNQHLAHTHDGGHDHDHDAPPQIRETAMTDEEKTAQDELFSSQVQKQNLQELHDTLLSLFWNE